MVRLIHIRKVMFLTPFKYQYNGILTTLPVRLLHFRRIRVKIHLGTLDI